jgi:transglutaminase-like putative cysteine protease
VGLIRTPALASPAAWRALPRDARDTLFLLAVIGWTVLPHLPTLPAWCSALTFAVLLWRGRLAWTNGALPPRWVLVAILLVALGLTIGSHGGVLGKEPGVTLAVVLMALKTLELRARRDAFVVFFLGFFLVLTHFLYSQSLPVAAAMLVSVWGLLTALVLAHMPVGQPSLLRAAGLAGRTALLGLPIMALLFVLFPRIGPLWTMPHDGGARTGLSNTLELGQMASVANDDSIALRLRFLDGPPPPSRSLYIRGPVLGSFDGRAWRPLQPSFPPALQPNAGLAVRGPARSYEVTIEPGGPAVLPMLEATTTLAGDDSLLAERGADLVWRLPQPLNRRVRLLAQAHQDFTHGPRTAVVGLQDYLDLPAGYNPRTLAWAASLRRQPGLAESDARTLADHVLNHIRTGGYSYTMSPGRYGDGQGRHAIDEFFLDRREGFCEHFAAAFVVVMRALDVPARIVTGYQGADPRPVDGFVVVRQSAAHAWAEYWQPGEGWVRADPTAMVAPDRIRDSRVLTPEAGLVAGALDAFDVDLLARLREGWEMLDNRWNQWVLSYSRERQMDLLRRLGVRSPTWEDLALLAVGALTAVSLVSLAVVAWQHRRQDPWTRLLSRLRPLLWRIGVRAPLHATPRLLAAAVRERHGPGGEPLALLLDELDRWRYARPDPAAATATRGSPAPAGWLSQVRRAAQRLPTSEPTV